MNTAWMWGALLATSIAGRLHQLTTTAGTDGTLYGHGPRGGKAMIATLRHLIIRVPGRPVSHTGHPVLRLPPAGSCSPKSSPGSAHYPPRPDQRRNRPDPRISHHTTRAHTRARTTPTDVSDVPEPWIGRFEL